LIGSLCEILHSVQDDKPLMRMAILSVVLFLSGISALIFETLWLLAANALAPIAADQ
jgi:hypothetical protein